MKLQRIFAVTAVAAFTLSTLTACPWDNEEPGSPSSSSSNSSTRPSHDDDSSDSGDDTSSSTPEEPEDMGFTYDEETGYTITSSEGLMNWAKQENVTTADCTLDADVEVSNWTKIGDKENPYTGTFNGNGKTISGLDAPLFYTVAGTVKNLTIQGMIDEDFAGGVARVNNGTIENCTINADVTGTSTIGGMVAVNQRGTIKGCDEEIKDMNTYLTDCEYEFALNKEKQPVLVKKGSAEQAVNRLLGHFWG